jgi:hypothetical protein
VRIERVLDVVLGILCPILAVGLILLGLLMMFASVMRDVEAPWFLFVFGLANLLLAFPFAAATWLVHSHEPKLSRWRLVAAIGLVLYCLSFVWPYVDRVWRLMRLHGRGSILHYAWEHAGILVNGGLGVKELGAPFSVCLLLFLLRTALAHVEPDSANEA